MEACKVKESQLAKIESQKENDVAAQLIGTNGEVLIGLKDDKWGDDTALSASWSPPWYSGRAKERCVRLIGAQHSWEPG